MVLVQRIVLNSEILEWGNEYYNILLNISMKDEYENYYVFLDDINFDSISELVLKENARIPSGVIYSITSLGKVDLRYYNSPFEYSL